MNLDDIQALISKHGSITAQPLMDLVVTVVLEAVEAEREACAKIAEKMLRFYTQGVTGVAEAIRARGEE